MSLAKCIALIVVSFNNPIGQWLPARLLTKREGGGGGGGGERREVIGVKCL